MGLRDAGPIRDTYTFKIRNPVDGGFFTNADGSHQTITVVGPYSAAYQKIKRDMDRKLAVDERVRMGDAEKQEAVDEIVRETMARIVVDWSVTFDSGADAKPVPFSLENVLAAFDEFPWLYEQVDREFSRTANFFGPPPNG